MMHLVLAGAVLAAAVITTAVAQDAKPKPAEARAPTLVPAQSLQQQQRVSDAYRELQKARYELRFIEQDYQNAVDDDKLARGRAQTAAEIGRAHV